MQLGLCVCWLEVKSYYVICFLFFKKTSANERIFKLSRDKYEFLSLISSKDYPFLSLYLSLREFKLKR